MFVVVGCWLFGGACCVFLFVVCVRCVRLLFLFCLWGVVCCSLCVSLFVFGWLLLLFDVVVVCCLLLVVWLFYLFFLFCDVRCVLVIVCCLALDGCY